MKKKTLNTKTKSAKKTKAKQTSVMDMAAALGVSRTTFYTWKKEGCNVDDGIEAIITWAADNGKLGVGTSAEMLTARLGVYRETERRLRLANDERAGMTVSKDEVHYALGRGTAAIFAELEKFADVDAPVQLVGLDQAGICLVLRAAVANVRENFRACLEALLKDPQGPAEAKRVDAADHGAARKLFDLRVQTEAKWRNCTDPAERSRIWHEELNPILNGSSKPLSPPAASPAVGATQPGA